MWTWLSSNAEAANQLAGALQSIIAAAGILIGGIWTFRLFVKNRLNQPCAATTHQVTTELLPGHGLLVHVGVEVKNDSAILMQLTSGEVRLVPILPLADDSIAALAPARLAARDSVSEPEVQWPGMRSYKFDWSKEPREIEPHESDTFHFDFVVDNDLTAFQVYSYLKNVTKHRREIGWATTSFHRSRE